MAESSIPYEERELLVSVLANQIGYTLYGQRKISSDTSTKLKNAARSCLDVIEEDYILEEANGD